MDTTEERRRELEETPVWKLTQSRYQFLRGVKQPHIMEISEYQFSRFSRRGKEDYQSRRAAEWDASGKCKLEYNRLVWEAYQRGEFTEQSEGVTPDAKAAVYGEKKETREQENAAKMRAAEAENRILSVADAEIGDTVFALYGSRYVKIVGKFRTSFKVQAVGGGETFTVKAAACQWLHYNELVKAVEEGRPVNPHKPTDPEPPQPSAPAAAVMPSAETERTTAPVVLSLVPRADREETNEDAGPTVTVTRAEELIHELMDRHGMTARGWTYKFDGARRRLGCCDYENKCLSFSVPFIKANDEAELIDTIKHEIAHALAGSAAKHGRIWKAHALALGCRPQACGGREVASPEMRYHALCPECGNRTDRDVLPRARRGPLARPARRGARRQRTGQLEPCETFCSGCLDKHGRTRANYERFKLSWIETRTGRAVEWPPKPAEAPKVAQPQAETAEPEAWKVEPITHASQPTLFQ